LLGLRAHQQEREGESPHHTLTRGRGTARRRAGLTDSSLGEQPDKPGSFSPPVYMRDPRGGDAERAA